MKRTNYIAVIFTALGLVSGSCEKVFDKENLNAVNPGDVWSSEALAEAYINNVYSLFMPGMPFNGGASDEAPNSDGLTMQSILKGAASVNTVNYWPYANIRKINILLQEIETSPLDGEFLGRLKGQALFFRAWAYFEMTKLYGGVPLVLHAQSLDEEELSVPRSNAAECFAQIARDLDEAAGLLPEEWTGSDYGRIDKGTAMAFKGRVLLFFASPQFNPAGDMSRWTAAYDANKAAKEFLESKGKGLFQGDYEDIWYQEGNKEVIMVNQYFNPGHTHNQNLLRPIWATRDNVGFDRPSLKLVNAFPMTDGSAFDPSAGYGQFYKDRDNRFYANIAYNGTTRYNIKELVNMQSHLWMYDLPTGDHSELILYGGHGNNYTGFYRLKAVDKDIDASAIDQADVDWIEIRFTEVLMNYGEAANETGKTGEAMQVLKDVRERAGIAAGPSGNYGLTASSQSDIREAYINERFVEFAFENKRWDDLRRWRRFDILNEQVVHKGLLFTLKAGETPPKNYDNIDNVWNKFTWEVFNVESAAGEVFNIPDSYYFFGIPESYIQKDVKLEQTVGWDGGTFDPLQ
ncbi:putative outer membrane starch-binding protein [Anseongella ginsenosidimutans]|uniref:Putative outer membrane starch-binding protein n=1 Tax=Anseongella ginsenosidimutans TaxID=496056 RepID=A0A4R3KLM2_9SPHI|nr:RagB/SusD family nutrient uptake outer membrane protein [Anseongella ginsenosidimutans]QEC51937.1 RagB/SusD family nutrient uptake outer membrane protein [Anseongella ginsenosidimutans]TCS85031.1 putative outer membrane starch-binding protein [Anseongella ginsenosidimutans]